MSYAIDFLKALGLMLLSCLLIAAAVGIACAAPLWMFVWIAKMLIDYAKT